MKEIDDWNVYVLELDKEYLIIILKLYAIKGEYKYYNFNGEQ